MAGEIWQTTLERVIEQKRKSYEEIDVKTLTWTIAIVINKYCVFDVLFFAFVLFCWCMI